ncbi:N-(5'-phosphoribosyl)anthranilate isomerase, partial [Rhizobium phaseoli]
SLLSWLDGSIDYMLSGGLNKDNVADALANTTARGIDVSSGVESAPGVKSVAMIDEFFDAVEGADAPIMASGS